MLRLNKLTDYAVVLLAQMERAQSQCSSAVLAAATGISEPTVAKILKDLVKSGLVQSARGAQGGYALTRTGLEISVRQIIEAIDGPIALTECIEGSGRECGASNCAVRGNWGRVNGAIIDALEAVKLTDMMRPQTVQIKATG